MNPLDVFRGGAWGSVGALIGDIILGSGELLFWILGSTAELAILWLPALAYVERAAGRLGIDAGLVQTAITAAVVVAAAYYVLSRSKRTFEKLTDT